MQRERMLIWNPYYLRIGLGTLFLHPEAALAHTDLEFLNHAALVRLSLCAN